MIMIVVEPTTFIAKLYFSKIAGRIQEEKVKKKILVLFFKRQRLTKKKGLGIIKTMKTHHYIVKGHVQGVAFRHYTQRAAYEYGIRGTVKNLPNGDVEVYAQGEEEQLRNFETFLETGPRMANVTSVCHQEWDNHTLYAEFHIVY